MNNSLEQMAFDRHRIMRVEAPSETTRVIFVRHYDTELNLSFPMRWWLVKTDAGWRVFDLQDFSTGLRSVELMGILLRAGVGAKAEPWVNDFIPALTLMRSLDLDDPEQYAKLEDPMEELRKHQMPNTIRSFASTMMVGIFQVSERNSEARAELEAALAGGYNSPLWHYQMAGCLVGEERFDDAIKELEEHADAFGWDSDSLEMLADCHFNAGRLEESRAAALRGLEDCPGTAACLASLAAASTPDQLRDPATAAHFAMSTDPESSFEIALDYLITLESTEKALALFEVFRAAHPESDLILYYEEELGLASEE
jgi:tetratricopeptide (TPR) repeat protein